MSLSDIKSEYGINSEEVIDAVNTGVLSPTVVIPLFLKDDIMAYINGNVESEKADIEVNNLSDILNFL